MSNTIQSVERALKILLLLNNSTPMTVQNISKALDISRTTLYPIINTLEQYGFVSKNEDTKTINMGWKIYELGLNYKHRLSSASRDIARKLRQKWNQNVYIGVYAEDNIIVFILAEVPEHPFIYSPPLGFFYKAHATASGKVLLANLPQDKLNWIHDPGALTQLTSNTISNADKLLESLEEIRITGFSTENGESLSGIGCIAAPIKNSLGQVIASISIGGSKDEIFANIDAIKMDLSAAATEISKSVGLDF